MSPASSSSWLPSSSVVASWRSLAWVQRRGLSTSWLCWRRAVSIPFVRSIAWLARSTGPASATHPHSGSATRLTRCSTSSRCRRPSTVRADSRWCRRLTRASGRPSASRPRLERSSVDTTLHSEVATFPLSFHDRGIREVTFRQGFETEFRDRLSFLVQLGLAGTTPLASVASRKPNGRDIVPRDVLLALVGSQQPPVPIGKPVRYEVLRTVVGGRHRGRRVTVVADCHAPGDAGWGIGPDIDTGAPPSIAVQLMLSGEIALRPGVWAPEQVVPVEPFLRELGRRGMLIRCRKSRTKHSAKMSPSSPWSASWNRW